MSGRAVRKKIEDLAQTCHDIAWGLQASDVGDVLPRLLLRVTREEFIAAGSPWEIEGVAVTPTLEAVDPETAEILDETTREFRSALEALDD